MNKIERKKLVQEAMEYCRNEKNLCSRFSNMIDDLKDKEEIKLDNLPEGLQDGKTADFINDTIDLLEEIQDSLETIEDSLDSISCLVTD